MAALSAAAAPYSVKAIRQIRAQNSSSDRVNPSQRLLRRKETAYKYFLEKVDPILGECITHLLLEQPADVIRAMIAFLQRWKGSENVVPNEMTPLKARKELKLFLATSIGPVVSKLVNRVAVKLPEDVVAFMIQELERMLTEDALNPDRIEPTATTSAATAAHSSVDGLPPMAPQKSGTAEITTSAKMGVIASSGTAGATPSVPVPVRDTASAAAPPVQRTVQIGVLGLDGSGKSTIVNALQGKFDPKIKPTIGFHPLTLMLGENTVLRLFDLGGGKKIREIWDQYYHDIHGIIYVLDATSGTSSESETVQVFEKTMCNPYLKDKPLLIFANKQDLPGARSAASWQDALPGLENFADKLFIAESSCHLSEEHQLSLHGGSADEHDHGSHHAHHYYHYPEFQPDPNIESAIEMLCNCIMNNFDFLQSRVAADSQEKGKQEARKKIEREKKVLRNKIASAYFESLPADVVQQLQIEADPSNVFDEAEGLTFLAAEIGEEVDRLPDIARKIAQMVGFQRLALQIVGALKAPISRKKVPMSWDEIYGLVHELRLELHLPEIAAVV